MNKNFHDKIFKYFTENFNLFKRYEECFSRILNQEVNRNSGKHSYANEAQIYIYIYI